MKLTTLPGVFEPRSDSWSLAEALRAEGLGPATSVLDLCTGSGVLAVTAALAGAGDVVAIDLSRRAVLSARLNARRNGVRVRALRGDLLGPVKGRRFDVIVSNPPYLPAPDDRLPRHRASRAWEAGRDGRALIDRICAQAPEHLRPGGRLLLMHSSVCGPDATLRALRGAGLEAAVAARRRGRLGPLLADRVDLLASRGLLPDGRPEEELVVIRGLCPEKQPAVAAGAPV